MAHRAEGFQRHVAARYRPLVILLQNQRADEADDSGVIRERLAQGIGDLLPSPRLVRLRHRRIAMGRATDPQQTALRRDRQAVACSFSTALSRAALAASPAPENVLAIPSMACRFHAAIIV